MITDNENLDKIEKNLATDTYENTLLELNKIMKSIENQECNLDGLLTNVEAANQLIQECKHKLRDIENRVDRIL